MRGVWGSFHYFRFVSSSVCVRQRRNRPFRLTAFNAHGVNASPMGAVLAQISSKPSRAGLALSHSELVDPGAATCAFRGMAGPPLKRWEHTYHMKMCQHNGP